MSFRKIISILLALTFLAAALPFGAAAAGGSGIRSIEVYGFEIIEHTHGWSVTSELGSGGVYDWYEYNIEPDYIVVTFTNGDTEDLTPSELREQGYSLDFFAESPQEYDSPWGLGEHRVTAQLEDVETTYIITVVESPIDSVIAIGRTYMEGTNCWQHTKYDIEGNMIDQFIWYDEKPASVIISYKDNTQLVCEDPDELESLTGYEGHWYSNQDDEHWGAGKHTATFEYLGATCTYEINITESPYLSVSVDKVTITEGTNCYPASMDGVEYTRYSYRPDYVTVTFKDKTSRRMTDRELQEEFGEVGVYDDDQGPGNEWGVGPHTAHYRLGNLTCDFEVEILEGPVKSIRSKNYVCVENMDGYETSYYDYETNRSYPWFRYEYNRTVVFITLRDDTEITTMEGGFEYEGEYYRINCVDNQSYFNQWQVGGEYTGTLSVCGKSCDLTVWIDPNPIDRIEVDPIVLTENVDGYLWYTYDFETGEYRDPYIIYDYYPDYTVYFKDGTSQRSDRGWIRLFDEDFCIEYWDGQEENHWGVGDHPVEMRVAGCSTTAIVKVVPDNIKNVTISGTDDLAITFNYKDNTSETFHAENFEQNGGREGVVYCKIETREGRDLRARISYEVTDEGVNKYDTNFSAMFGTHETNTLAKCGWLKKQYMMDDVVYYSNVARSLLGFGGYEEGEEYDPAAVAMIATLSSVYYNRTTDYSEDGTLCLAQYERATVEAAVGYVFGIDDFDASKIEYNDPSDPDHVWIRVPGAVVDYPGWRDSERIPGGWGFYFRPDDPEDMGYGLLTVSADDDLVVHSIAFGDEVKVTDIEISGDTELNIRVTFSDGTEAEGQATEIEITNVTAWPLEAHLFTDNGDTDILVYYDGTEDGTHRFVTRNVSIGIDGVESNKLSDNAWLKSRLLGNSVPFVTEIFKLCDPNYGGVDVANASANDLVMFAAYVTGYFENYESYFANGKPYIKVPTELAKDLVSYVFGVDLNVSGYKQIGTSGTGQYLDVELLDFDFAAIPDGTTDITYENGVWTLVFTVTGGDPGYDSITVTAGEHFSINKIAFGGAEPQFDVGDADGDGNVNMKDVLLLRKALAGAAALTPEQAKRADVNGDGDFNMKDILMLRKILAGAA